MFLSIQLVSVYLHFPILCVSSFVSFLAFTTIPCSHHGPYSCISIAFTTSVSLNSYFVYLYYNCLFLVCLHSPFCESPRSRNSSSSIFAYFLPLYIDLMHVPQHSTILCISTVSFIVYLFIHDIHMSLTSVSCITPFFYFMFSLNSHIS